MALAVVDRIHRDAAVTGLQAASFIEYCPETTGYGDYWYRPYQEPYVLEHKYAQPNSAALDLPPALVQQLDAYIDSRPESP